MTIPAHACTPHFEGVPHYAAIELSSQRRMPITETSTGRMPMPLSKLRVTKFHLATYPEIILSRMWRINSGRAILLRTNRCTALSNRQS